MAASEELLAHQALSFRSRQYSAAQGRSLSAMDAQRALHRTGKRVIVRPFLVLAAKCLGPGRLRLRMVKLAHEMGDGQNFFEVFYGRQRLELAPRAFEATATPPSQRAA